jgi:branched-chain amino acid transport system substrate-binding protein
MRVVLAGKPRLACAAAVLALGVLGACGAPSAPTGVACATPGVTADQVNLGLVFPETGDQASSFLPVRAGIDARLALANAQGGVNGRKVVYDWRDDQDAATQDAVDATQLTTGSKAVFGLLMETAGMSTSAADLTKRQIPVVGLASEPLWLDPSHDNMFSFVYSGVTDTYGQYVKASGGTKAAELLYPLNAEASAYSDAVGASVQAVGVPVVAKVNYVPGNEAAAAQTIINSGANAVVGAIDAAAYGKILNAARAGGADIRVAFSPVGYDGALLKSVGAAMAGISVPVFHRPFERGGPAVTGYLNAMNTYAPELVNPAQELAVHGYIDADIYLRGLAAAGSCPTRAGFIQALNSTTDYNASGLIEPTKLTAASHATRTCVAFVKVSDDGSKFVVVNDNVCGAAITA